ncbi:uncharacterized protein LOC129597412 [Paramacrobiotus metropolitanus]|uniref:uncharacterized protein LOC129597412 n=1 Tax=Paramacrobiotus metropolitanus TaxID=2943436 RepID=UPI002445A024|nr:uncharacterized protein LOC129597412 [Paramacrobiotus metropolitanus]
MPQPMFFISGDTAGRQQLQELIAGGVKVGIMQYLGNFTSICPPHPTTVTNDSPDPGFWDSWRFLLNPEPWIRDLGMPLVAMVLVAKLSGQLSFRALLVGLKEFCCRFRPCRDCLGNDEKVQTAMDVIFGYAALRPLLAAALHLTCRLYEDECKDDTGAPKGRTRQITSLDEHPYAVEPVDTCTPDGRKFISERSFAYLMAHLWNEIKLPQESYNRITSFDSCLDTVEWADLKWTKRFLQLHVDHYCLL